MRCQHSEEYSSRKEPGESGTLTGSSTTAATKDQRTVSEESLSEKAIEPIPQEVSSFSHRSC